MDVWKRYAELLALNLNIEPCEVVFNLDHGKKFGYFDGKKIHLKSDLITVDNLFTFAHEFYHYYQTLTRYSFDEIIENYKSYGNQGYKYQRIEMEAYAFQEMVMRELFGIVVKYSEPLVTCEIEEKLTYKDSELRKTVLFLLAIV